MKKRAKGTECAVVEKIGDVTTLRLKVCKDCPKCGRCKSLGDRLRQLTVKNIEGIYVGDSVLVKRTRASVIALTIITYSISPIVTLAAILACYFKNAPIGFQVAVPLACGVLLTAFAALVDKLLLKRLEKREPRIVAKLRDPLEKEEFGIYGTLEN